MELISDREEQLRLFAGIDTIPAIRDKAKWCLKWIENSSREFAERLVAFALVEGVFFCSSFAAIFWLRSCGLMQGLTHSNELISRDEGLHLTFACELYRKIGSPVPAETIYDMMREAVALEQAFFEGTCM